jgi:hypothetical protein
MLMNIRRGLIIWWMVAGLQVLSAGQNPPAPNPPVQNSGDDGASSSAGGPVRTAPAAALSVIAGMQGEGGTDDAASDLPQIPALLGGKGNSLEFLSELERSNYLRGGVNVGAAYDDNPHLVPTGLAGNASVSIFPNISIEESTSRMRWTLGYAGGLTVNQGLTNENQQSHNLNFDSEYRLSPHVNLRVAEVFSMTTGFFDAGNSPEGVAESGGPNTSLITPLATQRSSLTTVEANYHFALNDLVGASGSFYDLHFTNVPAETQAADPLTNSESASGSAFWLHRLFRGDWGGASYGFERLTFSLGDGETSVHSFLAVNTLNLSKRITLTGFIGPQYSVNQGLAPAGLPTQSSGWSVAGGAEAGWQNRNTNVSAGYARSISDGGGILGAVRLQTVHGDFRRELVRAWTADLTATHGTNQSIIVPTAGSASAIDLTSAGIALEHTVRKSVGFRCGYSHDFQQQLFGFTVPPQTYDAHRNRYFVTLSYEWGKPLGM